MLVGGVINGDKTINANPATLIIPTGSIEVKYKDGEINFTVPVGIHVIKTDYEQCNSSSSIKYVGVTPGTIHRLKVTRGRIHSTHQYIFIGHLICTAHKTSKKWGKDIWNTQNDARYLISWSPEINKETPTVKDY